MLQGLQISYRGKSYRVQNVNGWKHIIVTTDGVKKRIGLSSLQPGGKENDWCFSYVFGGLSVTHPCPAIDYFIHRHRLGNRISAADYKIKFKIKTV